MKLVWDERALSDLEGIYNWIVQDNPAAAKAVVDRVFESVDHLATFPRMGHVGRDEGTLEWVVPRLPYIVVYELDEARDEVMVIAVFHGAQSREGEN